MPCIRPSSLIRILCGGLLLGCGASEPAPAAPEAEPARVRPPDVVLVVVDTLRADHLGAYGHARPTSPHLDALAASGIRFDRAYAQSGWTLASFASLLTGRYPHDHKVARDGCMPERYGRMAPATRTVAESMKGAGYATAAWVNNTFLAPDFGLQDGFDVYDYKGATNIEHRTAAATVSESLAWMDSQPADTPVFALVHFMEPHLDYAPPPATAGRFTEGPPPAALSSFAGNPFSALQMGQLTLDAAGRAYLEQLYDEEILAADLAIGALVTGLRERGRLENTLLVVTSDHGEEFWEHGRFEHGHALWSELTRVPLVVAGPGVPAGKVVDTIVEHTDLVVGLTKRAGAELEGVPGDDLFAIAAAPTQPRVAMSENCLYGPSCVSAVTDTHRFMLNHVLRFPDGAPSREAAFAAATVDKVMNVWGLDDSHMERVKLSAEDQRAVGEPLARLVAERRGGLDPVAATDGPALPGFETFELLKELGYVDRPDGAAVPQSPCK